MITITIPTISRLGTIQKTVDSIFSNNLDISIKIIVDGEKWKPYYEKLKAIYSKNKIVTVLLNKNRSGWGGCVNYSVKTYNADFYISASDDLMFDKDAIIKAKRIMKHHFPDGDGVVGFNQKNMRHFCPGAFVVFGDKWADRFPDRQVYFPQYKHFCVDSELWHYAKSENKFAFAENANVKHIRPNDECHRIAQKTLNRDRQIWWQKKGNPKRYWPTCQRLNWRTDLGLKKPDPWE